MLVRIVVVNYNSETTLRRCLECICAQTHADFEVIVVNNGPIGPAFAAAIPPDSRIHCHYLDDNAGFAAGTNAGAHDVTAPWLATVNPDAFVEPGWLAALIEAARLHPDVSMFGSTQLDATDPCRLDGAGDVYSAIGIPWRGHHGRPVTECPATGETFSPCAAAALYRSSVFQAAGGFDPSFFCYCEDVDIGFRLRLRGERCLQVREAVVYHVGSASTGQRSAFSTYHGFRNRLWTFIKCMPQPLFGALLPFHLAATVGLLAIAGLRGQFRPAARGITDALLGLRPVLEQRRQVQAGRVIGWRQLASALTWSPAMILGRYHDVRPLKADGDPPSSRLSPGSAVKTVGRSLWRALPVATRRRAFDLLSERLLPRAAGRRSHAPTTIVVAGLFRTASGIGESARLCYHALARRNHPVAAFDLSGLFDQVDFDPGIPLVRSIDDPAALVIIHVNAPEVLKALWVLGRRSHPGWTVVGYWAWELPEFPAGWARAFPFLDEVWTPSAFCAAHLRHAEAPPIRVVPHPVCAVPPQVSEAARTRFGLPDHAFIALTFADARSSLTRKNPAAAIDAFLQAFGDRSDTLLLIKTRNLAAFPDDATGLGRYRSGHANLRFLDGTLANEDVAELVGCSDAIVSLHRSEGFGLCLAEGMALGKPVVASAWSGNLDFMDEKTAMLVPVTLVPVRDPSGIYSQTTAQWADPDVSAAAVALIRLEQDRAFARALGHAAQDSVQSKLSAEAYETAIGLLQRPVSAPPLKPA